MPDARVSNTITGRDAFLRVLSDEGHLSNAQAAELVQAVLVRSSADRPRHLVQLHLSRDCNRPALARAAAQAVLTDRPDVIVHTAEQNAPGATLHLGTVFLSTTRPPQRPRQRRPATVPTLAQRWLPGLGEMNEQ